MWYELTFTPDDNDTWLVRAPAFPEVVTFGETDADAHKYGRLAIEEVIAARMSRNEPIPQPLKDKPGAGHWVDISAMVFLKIALYMTMRSKGMTRADLMRALGCQREHVDRLLRLEHNSKLDSFEAAFDALGVKLRFDIPMPEAA